MSSNKLRKIQLCQLDMLKQVKKICEQHNLKYWLAYGTFLGAIRHKGFIPWDDDLDIYMPIEDYKKLEREYINELGKDYFLQSPKTQNNAKWLYYKIRKNNTLMVEPCLESESELHQGIWIDIFPLIRLGDSERKVQMQYKILKKLQGLRYYHLPNTKAMTSREKIRESILNLCEKILWEFLLVCGSKKSKKYLIIENQFYGDGYPSNTERAILDEELLECSEKYIFEDDVFNGFCDSSKYLTKMYGNDYMTPKRYNPHIPDYNQVIVL